MYDSLKIYCFEQKPCESYFSWHTHQNQIHDGVNDAHWHWRWTSWFMDIFSKYSSFRKFIYWTNNFLLPFDHSNRPTILYDSKWRRKWLLCICMYCHCAAVCSVYLLLMIEIRNQPKNMSSSVSYASLYKTYAEQRIGPSFVRCQRFFNVWIIFLIR